MLFQLFRLKASPGTPIHFGVLYLIAENLSQQENQEDFSSNDDKIVMENIWYESVISFATLAVWSNILWAKQKFTAYYVFFLLCHMPVCHIIYCIIVHFARSISPSTLRITISNVSTMRTVMNVNVTLTIHAWLAFHLQKRSNVSL